MSKQMNTPQLRFPEFQGDWEKKKLGRVVTNKSGKYNPEKETHSVKCIELEHLASETSQLLGYIDGKNSASIKNKFEKGDVLFGKLRPYLKKYLLAPFGGVCSSEIWVLKGIDISNDFLFRIVQTNSFIDLANQSSGSKMPRADWNLVENGIFSFPSLPEQTKIASFLTAVDEKIQALKKKHSLLEQYKKGVMQGLFCQNQNFEDLQMNRIEDDNNPEILKSSKSRFRQLRFKDENGKDFPEWEVKKLGEIGEIVTGKTPSTAESDLWDGEIQFVTPTDINKSKYQFQTQRTIKKLPKTRLLPPKSIMFTCIASIGKMSLSVNFCVTNQQINSIIPSNYFDNEFVYYALLNIVDYIKSTQSTNTLPIINKTEFSQFEINIPKDKKEQTAIANFLSAIDKKINQTQMQIQKTEVWKKGLLQKMFV